MKPEIDTLLNLAYIYMNYGKTRRAIDYLLIAYRIDPHNIQVKKMKIAAFKDIGAFSQALDISIELETKTELEPQDKITLKLMKSFCLKGLDQLEEGQKVFAEYVKERKNVATKTYIKQHRKKVLKASSSKAITDQNLEKEDTSLRQDLDKFIKRA